MGEGVATESPHAYKHAMYYESALKAIILFELLASGMHSTKELQLLQVFVPGLQFVS